MTQKQDRLAAPSVLDAVRACYGGLLLAAPRRMLTMCTPGQASPRALGVVRMLGARHLLQAVLTAGVLSARGPSEEIPPGRALLAGWELTPRTRPRCSGSRWLTGHCAGPLWPTHCWRAAWPRSGSWLPGSCGANA